MLYKLTLYKNGASGEKEQVKGEKGQKNDPRHYCQGPEAV